MHILGSSWRHFFQHRCWGHLQDEKHEKHDVWWYRLRVLNWGDIVRHWEIMIRRSVIIWHIFDRPGGGHLSAPWPEHRLLLRHNVCLGQDGTCSSCRLSHLAHHGHNNHNTGQLVMNTIFIKIWFVLILCCHSVVGLIVCSIVKVRHSFQNDIQVTVGLQWPLLLLVMSYLA